MNKKIMTMLETFSLPMYVTYDNGEAYIQDYVTIEVTERQLINAEILPDYVNWKPKTRITSNDLAKLDSEKIKAEKYSSDNLFKEKDSVQIIQKNTKNLLSKDKSKSKFLRLVDKIKKIFFT